MRKPFYLRGFANFSQNCLDTILAIPTNPYKQTLSSYGLQTNLFALS